MSDITPITATPARELSSYPHVPRGPVLPTLLGILSGYPAIQYAMADILGFTILGGAANIKAGNWYYLNLANGPFSLTLPLLGSLNLGDGILIATDQNARTNPATILCQGTDLIQGETLTFTSLTCDFPHDSFMIVRASAAWNIA